MSASTENPDLLVVGGGVIGLSVAWRARERGMSVTLLERDAVGSGASSVAAGMLAPVAEVEFGGPGRQMLELALRSAELWREFAGELEAIAGETVGYAREGTLMVARDDDEARELERQIAFRQSLGLSATRVLASRARELEPALAPTIRLGLELPDDRSVDPRRVITALRRACALTGVRLRERAPVERVLHSGATATGVELEGAEQVRAGAVVVATGAWKIASEGLGLAAELPVRPVKGQTLRLRDPAGPGLVARSLRFAEGYLVPRRDGTYVLGATVEERGFDEAPTAGAAYELLRDAHELVPGISELQIEELCVGLRPGTPDNLPMIGPGALEGLTWATGHYRNGILLAPLTADLVMETLTADTPADPALATCSPGRFGGPSRHPHPVEAGAR
jgi:glycine oxidase